MQKRLVIIDGNSLINRAFFAIQQRLTNKDGCPYKCGLRILEHAIQGHGRLSAGLAQRRV